MVTRTGDHLSGDNWPVDTRILNKDVIPTAKWYIEECVPHIQYP